MPVSKINHPFTMAAAAFLAIIILSTSFTNAAPVPESLVDGVLKPVGKTGATTIAPILPLDLDKGALDADRKVQTGAAPLYDNNNLWGRSVVFWALLGPQLDLIVSVRELWRGARSPLACIKTGVTVTSLPACFSVFNHDRQRDG